MLNLLDAEDVEEQGMFTMNDMRKQMNDYIRVTSVVDSGCGEHVASRSMAPHISIKPSAGSERGQNYVVANGCRVPNEGEQHLDVALEDGGLTDMISRLQTSRKLFARLHGYAIGATV